MEIHYTFLVQDLPALLLPMTSQPQVQPYTGSLYHHPSCNECAFYITHACIVPGIVGMQPLDEGGRGSVADSVEKFRNGSS